ncbi:putative nucleic acid-binding Zn ribbon protein [Bradyrhizobium sp. CIR48]|nr:putative nucleic acid-binding Zn ribbon protein [Bradyrhizobium sp. CIR48]
MGSRAMRMVAPDYASLHPGYEVQVVGPVARMKRSAIRDSCHMGSRAMRMVAPDYASFHPGYEVQVVGPVARMKRSAIRG